MHVSDHAEADNREALIAPSYMTRVLRLTLLAPDIVGAILDGAQGPEVTLARDWSHFRWIGFLNQIASQCSHPRKLRFFEQSPM